MSPMWKDIEKEDLNLGPEFLNPPQLLVKQLSFHVSFPRKVYAQQTRPGAGTLMTTTLRPEPQYCPLVS